MKKILLIIDMQNDFIDGSLGTLEAQAIVPKVLEKIRSFDGDLFYTMDTHFEDYLKTQEGICLPVPHCIRGSQGWKLHPQVEALCMARGAKRVEKLTFGAPELPRILQEAYPEGMDSIELIGLCTDICVICNALLVKSFFPETPIIVDPDCCAGVSLESHHNALEAMKMCQIKIREA